MLEFELMNEITELVYISDPVTYDLLYINDAGKRNFGIKDVHGLKCYQALQNLDVPCPFCTNSILKEGETYSWEITNEKVNRHYLLKDRLVNFNGKTARLEIAIDITETENEKIMLQNALDAEKMLMDCVSILYQGSGISSAVNRVLEYIGTALIAQRAYIFQIKDNRMFNTYEWCAEGIEPEINLLQNLNLQLVDRWQEYFAHQECVIIENTEDIREISPEEYEILSAQNITSLVAAPLQQEGRLLGYIGVDNPPVGKLQNISSALMTLGYFLLSTFNREEDQEQLTRMSYYDGLTGLFNRNRYMHDLEEFKQWNGTMGIAYLDVNGLKDINDQHGHTLGDQILVLCANKMKKSFEHASFYRIGGDEFVVLCPGVTEEEFTEMRFELKRQLENEPLCQVAVGYRWVNQTADVQTQISAADEVMYEDKKKFYRNNLSSNRYRHNNDDVLGLTAPGVLDRVLKEGRFIVYLQPKVSFENRTLVGAEALIRYRAADDMVLAPSHFLPLLESAKMISKVDFYVFDFVCQKIKEWNTFGYRELPVSVNFSKNSLFEKGFVEHLNEICASHGVDKKQIEIEITESVEGTEEFDVKEMVKRIRKAGFAVSIDDFGVHYANLSLFTSIDFDVLKIDKSLVDDIVSNQKAQSVLGALVEVCKRMDIQIIAEGIETEEQFETLSQMKLGGAQGYLFNKPMPMPEFEEIYFKK